MMEFCKKCGNVMSVKKKRTKNVLACTKCGAERQLAKKQTITIKGAIENKKKDIIVMGKGSESMDLPTTKIICPKCEHGEAYWWMQQTRSADEPPTLFYRCTKCEYSWRSYG